MREVLYRSHRSLGRSEFFDAVGSGKVRPELETGTILIVRNFISAAKCGEVIDYLCGLREESFGDRLDMREGCRDAIQRVDTSGYSGGYRTINKSFYFFRFNGNRGPQAEVAEEMHAVQKAVSGLGHEEYFANTPQDLVIDRTEIILYPMDVGFVSCHMDPAGSIRANLGLYLTQFGKDYCSGGFYVMDESRQKVHFDRYVSAGDLILWYPNMPHGVDPVARCGEANGRDGRWFMAVNSVVTHHAKDRPKSIPWEATA